MFKPCRNAFCAERRFPALVFGRVLVFAFVSISAPLSVGRQDCAPRTASPVSTSRNSASLLDGPARGYAKRIAMTINSTQRVFPSRLVTSMNRHSAHPDHGRGEVSEGEEVGVAPVEAGCETSEVFELVEAPPIGLRILYRSRRAG
jgi:hypothetical protein